MVVKCIKKTFFHTFFGYTIMEQYSGTNTVEKPNVIIGIVILRKIIWNMTEKAGRNCVKSGLLDRFASHEPFGCEVYF